MQSLEKCIAKNVSVTYCKWKAMEAGLVTQILSLITGTEQKTWNAGMSISGVSDTHVPSLHSNRGSLQCGHFDADNRNPTEKA